MENVLTAECGVSNTTDATKIFRPFEEAPGALVTSLAS